MPSPKLQFQAVGMFVEVSLNWTVSGTVPEVILDVKLATGATMAAVTVIYAALELVLLPAALVTLRATV
jgi:hypothetical protein